MTPLDPVHFDKVEVQDRLKYSCGYVIGRLVHVLIYIVLTQVLGWNYFGLYCSALGTVGYIVVIFLTWRWERASSPPFLSWCSRPLAMGVALVIDSGLIAMSRLDVQHFLLNSIPGIAVIFGPHTDAVLCKNAYVVQVDQKANCQQQLQSHSGTTTQCLGVIVSFFVVFVLRDSQCSLISGLSFSVYATFVVAASMASEVPFNLVTHMDLWILIPTFAISVISKYKMTASMCLLMDFLAKQNKNVVQEKVLRCQAEFTCEQLASQFHTSHALGKPSISEAAAAQATPADAAAPVSEMALSVRTAPPAFQRQVSMHEQITLLCSEGGDCLPATAVAWVENCPVPFPLKSLSPGQRVLCYDNIARGVSYAKVTESHPAQQAAAADEIAVTLTDGTQLKMTADHPVTVQPSQEHSCKSHNITLEMRRQCLRAEELQADRDSLMVLKMVATPIANVTRVAAAPVAAECGSCMPENQWITVKVEQPERHEIFVAACNKLGEPGQPIAVGSSDHVPTSASQNMFCVKNSFIHAIHKESCLPNRSSSAPPSLKAYRSSGKKSSESDTVSVLSEISNSLSTESNYQNRTTVQIGPPKFDSLRLADFLHAKSAGVSIGSVHESEGDCRPCSFHFTWMHNPSKRPCKTSYMCEYCHDPSHHDCWRSKFRKLRKQPDKPKHVVPSSVPQVRQSGKKDEDSSSVLSFSTSKLPVTEL